MAPPPSPTGATHWAAVVALVVDFAERSEQQHAHQQSDVERQREAVERELRAATWGLEGSLLGRKIYLHKTTGVESCLSSLA